MLLHPTRLGEMNILLSAVLWSTFPVITILSFGTVPPLFSAGISTLLAALFFAFLLTLKHEWPLLLKHKAWKDILLTTLFIGIAFYGFLFLGLKHTSAGNAAILMLMEVFFSFLILGLLLHHEPLLPRTVIGGACMVLGALLVLLPKGAEGWQQGDLLIIIATIFAPLGNRFAQRARKVVTTNVIMFLRSIGSGAFLLLLAWYLEPHPTGADLSGSFGFVLINGILLLGLSKILWIEGIHRIPITKAISIDSITPLFTLVVAYFILLEQPNVLQVASLIPIGIGMVLLTKSSRILPSP
ncbi:MAG: DMT family transporter [Candidatus Peribacteraceae bacterium]|jgi:drug/metabolite transporter (DMT)-like permease|nr:DMT family transporter [Candidatus Peribacteraceae bacterium]